jgi:hypothetical protein
MVGPQRVGSWSRWAVFDPTGNVLVKQCFHFRSRLWPPSEPAAEFWIETTIAVEEGRYAVHFADDGGDWEELIADYDTRAELLSDIDAIEAFRHPEDPRA